MVTDVLRPGPLYMLFIIHIANQKHNAIPGFEILFTYCYS